MQDLVVDKALAPAGEQTAATSATEEPRLAHLSPAPHELHLLDRYELIEPEIPFSHAFPNGDIVSVHRDVEKTVAELARYSCKDAETWRTLMKRFCLQKDSITNVMFSPPPSFAAAAKEFAASSAGMEQPD